jgi:ribonuclease P protein subunit POP4
MITRQNLRIHELIGLKASVMDSLSLPYKGTAGLVVDETKHTLVLRGTDGVERRVPKKGCVFSFALPGGIRERLDGAKIAFRPYDRPKKLR